MKEHLDVSVYEDSLRCIFGKDAGIFFTIDKILYNTVKAVPTDELANYIFEENKQVFKKDSSSQAQCPITQLSRLLLKTSNSVSNRNGRSQSSSSSSNSNLFRVFFDTSTQIVYMNHFVHHYQGWSMKQVKPNKKYFEKFVSEQSPSNLSRKYRGVFKARSLR